MSASLQEKPTDPSKESFRARNAERDLKNDDERIERLDNLLQEVLLEVRRERRGLRERYENSQDNEIRPLDMHAWNIKASKVTDETELSLAHCVVRLKKLEAQDYILQQIQHDLARLQGITID